MLIFLTGAISVELLFLFLYRNSVSQARRLHGTGRLYDIVHTNNQRLFFKLMLIGIPLLVLLIFQNIEGMF